MFVALQVEINFLNGYSESPYMFMFLCFGVNTGHTFCPNCSLLLIILTNWIKTWLIKIKNFWCNLDGFGLNWLTLFHKQFIKSRYFSQHMVLEKVNFKNIFVLIIWILISGCSQHKPKSCGRKNQSIWNSLVAVKHFTGIY